MISPESLVDKVLETLLRSDVQQEIYTVRRAAIDPLNSPYNPFEEERFRFAVAPKSPLYEVAQLNDALSSVRRAMSTDYEIGGALYPAGRFRFLWFVDYFQFGELIFVEEDAVTKTIETSSSQPTHELWKYFDAQLPTYKTQEVETFPRRISIVMYPNKQIAVDSFNPNGNVYRMKMKEFKKHQREFREQTASV